MKFIQIISQTTNPQTREIYYCYRTINVSHIVKIHAGEGFGHKDYFFTLTKGENVLLDQQSYLQLINLLQEEWSGVKVLCVEHV